MQMSMILSVIACVLLLVLVIFVYKKLSHKRKFNDQPRTSGEQVEELYEDDDEDDDEDNQEQDYRTVDTNIVRSGNELFDTFVPIQQLFEECGIVDVNDGLIEFDADDGAKTFVGIAEMEQSNPFLKTSHEREIEDAENQLFLAGIGSHFKISLQWQVTDMHAYFDELREKIDGYNQQSDHLKNIGREMVNQAQDFEHSNDRFENHVYVQFIEKVFDDDIADAESKDDLNRLIYETANRKINNDILGANNVLKTRHHELTRLSNIEILDLIYKTFNRKTARLIPFDKIISEQKFSLITSADASDREVERINEMVQVQSQTNTYMETDPQIQKLKEQMQANYQKIMELRQREQDKIEEQLAERKRQRIQHELAEQKAQAEQG